LPFSDSAAKAALKQDFYTVRVGKMPFVFDRKWIAMLMLPRLLVRFFALWALSATLLMSACGPGEVVITPATLPPTITTQPQSVTSTGDQPTIFTLVATGGGLTYQWFKDGAALSGATGSSYTTRTAGSYTVTVTNSLGSITSSAAILTVSVDPVITVQPQSVTITAGKNTSLSVVATGVGLTYQWFRNSIVISGANGSSYTASSRTAATAVDSFYVVVSSSRAGAKTVTSSTVTLTISATAITPTITTAPVSLTVTTGTAASFAVQASGTDLVYQWFKNAVAIPSATSASYAVATVSVLDAGSYYVTVTNSVGAVTSSLATLLVTPVGNSSNTAVVVAAANVFISTLNASQAIVAGSTLSSSTVLFANNLGNASAWSDVLGTRHGLQLNMATLSVLQQSAADALISAALSTTGTTLMSEIRLSDNALANLNPSSGAGATLYSIAFIGQPSATLPWTLQLTGHQLTYNMTYNTSLPSATPMFLGAQPPNWTLGSGGVYTVNNTASTANTSGTSHAAMENQRTAVSALAISLQSSSSTTTTTTATVTASPAMLPNTMTDLLMGPTPSGDTRYKTVAYPTGTTGRGVLVGTLTSAQQAAVKTVVQAWVATQAAGVAQALLGVYLTDTALANTYVAYAPGIGGVPDFGAFPNSSALPGNASNSYLRIDGPQVWIEFIVASDGIPSAPMGNVYYRSVWRDKLADYGAQY